MVKRVGEEGLGMVKYDLNRVFYLDSSIISIITKVIFY